MSIGYTYRLIGSPGLLILLLGLMGEQKREIHLDLLVWQVTCRWDQKCTLAKSFIFHNRIHVIQGLSIFVLEFARYSLHGAPGLLSSSTALARSKMPISSVRLGRWVFRPVCCTDHHFKVAGIRLSDGYDLPPCFRCIYTCTSIL